MKKVTLLCALVLASFGVKAQGFYLDFNVGYGLGYPGRIHNDGTGLGTTAEGLVHLNVATQTPTIENVSVKSLNGGVGAGLNLQLTPGYMFNDHIGVELGINYYLGSKVLVQEVRNDMSAELTAGGNEFTHTEDDWVVVQAHSQSNQLRILPTLIVSTGATKKLSGYAKFGVVLPVFGSSTVSMERTDKSFDNLHFTGTALTADGTISSTTVQEQKITGAFTVGFKGAIGINYNITDKIGIFGEVFATSLQISRKHSELKEYSVNGVDQTASLTTYSKDIDYVKELNSSSNNANYGTQVDLAKARNEITSGTNFNQVGISIGVKYNF